MTANAKAAENKILYVLIWVAVILVSPFVFLLALYLRYPKNVSNLVLAVLGAAVALIAFTLLRKRRIIRVIGPAILALAVYVAAGVIPARRALYMIFYDSIDLNMTSTQVRRQFDLHFPDNKANGWPRMVAWPDRIQFVLDSGTGDFNAELIEIKLTNDRVSDKEYLPD